MPYYARDLVTLQLEVIDQKVNIAVNNSLTQVVEQIRDLKDEMNSRFSVIENTMNQRFAAVENTMNQRFATVEKTMDVRFAVIETKLGIAESKKMKVFDRWLDYLFKAGWLIALAVLLYAFLKFHITVTL